MSGELFIVATPIGNLGDMVPRAVEALQSVDLIAAEDTRHSKRLLNHFNINTPTTAYHDYSGDLRVSGLLEKLLAGKNIALISDAGTPLISDPGYRLVKIARDAGVRITPIPGACAAIAALSVSGLATNRFSFEGFLPAKSGTRIHHLERLNRETRTMVFYEAPHRIEDTLRDMLQVFGADREVVQAREITKNFETINAGSLADVLAIVAEDPNQQRGEIVLIVDGAKVQDDSVDAVEQERILRVLMDDLSVKQASSLAARLTGGNKKELYKLAVELRNL
jgi:16S rRNA (cytidine1402-2'-O)-methyltransferase